MGSPPQFLSVLVDTSTAVSAMQWLWLPANTCFSCVYTDSFDKSASWSYESQGVEEHLEYGSGECVGELSLDSVSIGSSTNTVSQTFVLVKAETGITTTTLADGVLVWFTQGMAFSALSDGYPTLVETLASSGVIENPTFLLHFSSNDSDSSYMELGATTMSNSAQAVALFQGNTNWNVPLTQATIGSSSIAFDGSRVAVLNSGSSKLGVPKSDYAEVLFALVPSFNNCGQYLDMLACPCRNISHTPDITLVLGSATFSIPTKYILFPLEEEGEELCAILLETTDVTVGGTKAWMLGDVFLRAHDVLFDMENMQIVIERDRSDSSSSSFPTWAIVLIAVIGGLGLIGAAIVLAYCICKRKRPNAPAYVSLRPPLSSPTALQPVNAAPAYQYPPQLYPVLQSPNYAVPSAPALPPGAQIAPSSPNLYPSF